LRLGAECEYREDGGRGGLTLGAPNYDLEETAARKRLYLEQVECAIKLILELNQLVGDDAMLLAFGDHGPDSLGQLFVAPVDWSEAAIEERLSILFVTNDAECGLSSVNSLVNVGRQLLACLGSEEIVMVQDRQFLAVLSKRSLAAGAEPIVEVTSATGP
jgi:hypothetical protein